MSVPPGRPNRGIATPNAPPQAKTGAGQVGLTMYTYFTSAPSSGAQPEVLYNGDRTWARITLTLETAGPVVVGQSQNIAPVLSGKGFLLDINVPTVIDVAKGNRIYILATAVNRVKVQVAPLPWLEQIVGMIEALGNVTSFIPNKLAQLFKRG